MSDAAGRSDLAPTDPSSKAWIKALRPSSVSSVLSEGPRRKLRCMYTQSQHTKKYKSSSFGRPIVDTLNTSRAAAQT